jgi:hypothetical protein
MAKKSEYKAKKRGSKTGNFVMLHWWFMDCVAWATMKLGPRMLYVELKRRYNGTNNGRITLSHREAAALMNIHRNTVGNWFHELQERGFIRETRGHCLGPSGIGETSHWALEEEPTDDMRTPPKSFMSWRPPDREHPKQAPAKQNPRTISVHGRHNNRDAPSKIGRNTSAPSQPL